ncbi:ABC transporter permease [Thermofilum pendens]|uniref:Daunorubicin resistance ABC transporter, inner membrane subunit B n=1 Tax=Thermofilum pendens (strain DSM 2475 / Hrk 5) TaxID=368408 RepID=A1S0K8_THEPD|nr:ABC transporter permease [Thermofilum pendens]ABL78988.1 daunorubicin resistance ABC transporter, inner membrane subunit B [Thermofilum pendens Hrk 5]
MRGLATMVYRQVKRFVNARSRLVMSVVQPVTWLVFFGMGWSRAFSFPGARAMFGGLDYLSYLASGMVAMTIIMGSFMSGISVIWDKQFGFLKETLVAPASRAEIIIGRALGDSLVVVFQSLIIMALMFLVAPGLNPYGVLPAVGYGLLLSLGFASIGIALSTKITSMEGFQMIVNLVTMPLLFLSGIFYPINTMPDWMKVLAYLDPATYAVDGMRYCLTGVSSIDPRVDVGLLVALTSVFLVVAAKSFEKTTIED